MPPESPRGLSDSDIEILTPLSPLQNSLLKKNKRSRRFAVPASPKENADPRNKNNGRPRPSYVAQYRSPSRDSDISPAPKKKRSVKRDSLPDLNTSTSSNDSWPSSHKFVGLMDEELPGVSFQQLSEARFIVHQTFREVHNKYMETVNKDEQQKFADFLANRPTTKKSCSHFNQKCMTFPEGSKSVVQRIESSQKRPKAKAWIHTEKNFLARDNLRLSHFPFVEKYSRSEKVFVEKIWNTYTEGVHGGDQGCGQHISDFEMLKLLQKLGEYKEVDHLGPLTKKLINFAIFTLFPNKLTYKEIQDEHTFGLMTKRFEGNAIETIAKKTLDNVFLMLNNRFCTRCGTLNCSNHEASTNSEVIPKKVYGTPWGIKFNDHVCSKTCGRTLTAESPDLRINVRKFQSIALANIFKAYLLRNPNMCQLREKMKSFCQDAKQKNFSCYEYTQLALIESTAEVPPQKKLNNDRHKIFKSTLRNGMDNGAVAKPCDHEGPCGKATTNCPCVVNRTACTLNCKCGPGCPALFPGCRCAPGSCRSNSCPCYFANWECNPITCRSCNSEVGGLPLPQGENDVLCSNIALQNGWKKKLRVGVSTVPNAGYGLFLEQDVESNELISEYTGEIISDAECERRGLIYDELFLSYTFTLVKDHSTVDAFKLGNVIRFANHKKAGKGTNCRGQIMRVNAEQRIGIYASRAITAGEELFFDYGYSKDHLERFKQAQKNWSKDKR